MQGPGPAPPRRARGAALAPQTPAVQSRVPHPVSGTLLTTCRMSLADATCGNARDAIRCRFMEVNLCVLLWAHDGRDAELSAYEDKVRSEEHTSELQSRPHL